MMKNWMKEAAILAAGLVLTGFLLRSAVVNLKERDRIVSVRGLAEQEVSANKVTWPLVLKDLGNDLPELYKRITGKNATVIKFLKQNGLKDEEISIGAPDIIDMAAERYSNNESPYRYNVTSVITVTSSQVDKIRKLISEQGSLLQQGIALTGGDYRYNVTYEYTDLNKIKPQMIEQATKNAHEAAQKFASDSESKLGKIKSARQGQFEITDRDPNTPHIKKVRVVTGLDYYLED